MSILIADDHPFSLVGLKSYVEDLGYQVDEICSNGITALNYIRVRNPLIAILDIEMPGMDGIEILSHIKKEKLGTRVILLTMHNENSIYKKALEQNAYGYLLKNFTMDELEACLKSVYKNKKYFSIHIDKKLKAINHCNEDYLKDLTLSEIKILELIGKQKTTKQIAEMLFIAPKTVEGHRSNIIKKLNLPKKKNSLLIWAINNFGH